MNDPSPSLVEVLPAILSLTLTTTASAFFLSYAWGTLDPSPSLPVPAAALDENAPGHMAAEMELASAIVSRFITTLLLLGPVLYLMRRWRPPFGTMTILFTTVSALTYLLLYERSSVLMALSVAVAGLTGDTLIALANLSVARPARVYLFGAALPTILWSLNMAAIWIAFGIRWPVELWSGVIVLSALIGLGVSLLAVPPRPPGEAAS